MKKWKLKNLRKRILMGLLLGTAILGPMMPSAYALPSEGTYASSNASSIVTNGNTMDITGTTKNNVVNWKSFSIANGETVNFTDSYNYLNLVKGINKSTIDGALNGTGDIYLVNPNGIIFGSNATVNVGSLIASTRAITNDNITDFNVGKNPITNSTIDSVVGNITNLGNITATSVVLEGNEVIIQNVANITSDGTNPLTGANVTIKVSDSITVGHKVDNQVDLDETTEVINNAADYASATISISGYTGKDLGGTNDKEITEAFLIEDIYDLQNMNANLTANYLLANNIDASETSEWSDTFTPVGTSSKAFSGSFNGAGNIIDGLNINKENKDNQYNQDYIGLFGYADGVTIKNIGLENSEVSGNYGATGGLIGYGRDITISNSHNTGKVNGNYNVGGLVGYANRALEISNSYNTGEITGDENTGGLVGLSVNDSYDDTYSNNSVTISNSYNTGEVAGNSNTGGLVGLIVNDSYDNMDSNNSITIINSYNTGEISGNYNVGGLVGASYNDRYNNIDNSLEISNSYNKGDVFGSTMVGGLVGASYYTVINNSYNEGVIISSQDYVGGLVGGGYITVEISNSYNKGDVFGYSMAGGLVGRGSETKITNSYNKGDIAIENDNAGGLLGYGVLNASNSYNIGKVSGNSNVGGILGYNEETYNVERGSKETKSNSKTTISNSYYATTDSDGAKINQESNDYGIGKTYTEMLQASTYEFNDDIDTTGGQDTTWRMYEGYTTPMLKSFMQTVEVIDAVDLYNGKEQIGTVITADGKKLSTNIYGNIGTRVGDYTIYSDQQGYDLVSSTGMATPVYKIKTFQSLVADKNEDYNSVVGASRHNYLPRPFFDGGRVEENQNSQGEIINNGESLMGANEAKYDKDTDLVIFSDDK